MESESYANEDEEDGGRRWGGADRFLPLAVNITVTRRQTGVISLTRGRTVSPALSPAGSAATRPELGIIKSRWRTKKKKKQQLCKCEGGGGDAGAGGPTVAMD